MHRYIVQLYTALAYDKSWSYPEEPKSFYPFNDPIAANSFFDEKLQDLPAMAATSGKAVKLALIRNDELIRTNIYDGEDVAMWYAAFHQPGHSEFEERYYIDRIYYSIGYYAFMHDQERNVTPVAIAATNDELRSILGDKYSMYDDLTE